MGRRGNEGNHSAPLDFDFALLAPCCACRRLSFGEPLCNKINGQSGRKPGCMRRARRPGLESMVCRFVSLSMHIASTSNTTHTRTRSISDRVPCPHPTHSTSGPPKKQADTLNEESCQGVGRRHWPQDSYGSRRHHSAPHSNITTILLLHALALLLPFSFKPVIVLPTLVAASSTRPFHPPAPPLPPPPKLFAGTYARPEPEPALPLPPSPPSPRFSNTGVSTNLPSRIPPIFFSHPRSRHGMPGASSLLLFPRPRHG